MTWTPDPEPVHSRDPGRHVDPVTGDDIWDFRDADGERITDGSFGGTSGTGSGSGSSSTDSGSDGGSGPDGPADYTDNEATRFNGLPGKPEIWEDEDGDWYVVYYPEGGPQPPVPLLFEITTEAEKKSLFGDKTPVADRKLTAEELVNEGAVFFGEMASIDRYNAQGELIDDPWAGFTSRMTRAMESMPWLAEDPEVFAIVAGAYLEGRELEEWELDGTDYFMTHSELERDAMRLQISDPEGYADRHAQRAITIYDEIASYGLDPSDDVVQWITNEYNSGRWTQDYALEQVQIYATGSGAAELDSDFDAWMTEGGYTTGGATTGMDEIRDLFDEYLGPMFPPDQATIASWVGRWATDPAGARDALKNQLSQQFRTLFPNYKDDPNATYATVSSPWKSYTSSIWGIPIDETDEAFQNIVQMNDSEAARKKAREVGSERGYERVVQSMVSDLESSMRRGVRGAV